MQISGIRSGGLHRGDLRVGEFDAGKNEGGSDQDTGDATERIERLRQVQSLLRTRRGAKLSNEWIRGCFEKSESARHDK